MSCNVCITQLSVSIKIHTPTPSNNNGNCLFASIHKYFNFFLLSCRCETEITTVKLMWVRFNIVVKIFHLLQITTTGEQSNIFKCGPMKKQIICDHLIMCTKTSKPTLKKNHKSVIPSSALEVTINKLNTVWSDT